jgi:hypothetical protein
LDTFAPSTPLTSLRTLKLSNNNLSSFSITYTPKVRTLYLDFNRLRGILGKSRRIQSLSIRSQTVEGLSLGYEVSQGVKRLYISGKSNATTLSFDADGFDQVTNSHLRSYHLRHFLIFNTSKLRDVTYLPYQLYRLWYRISNSST